jgi:hypothetical protein
MLNVLYYSFTEKKACGGKKAYYTVAPTLESTFIPLQHYMVSRVAQSVECLATGWTTG